MTREFILPPELLTSHSASLRALTRVLSNDEHAADDIVQETWLRALTAPPREITSPGGWLRAVAASLAAKRWRSEARRAARERAYAADRPEASGEPRTSAETLRAVVDAVLALDEPYRETVLLRWFEGVPPREIAARQRTTVATVNSRLQRAHARLRALLARRLDLDERGLRMLLMASFGGGAATPVIGTAGLLSGIGIAMTTKLCLFVTAAVALVCALWLIDRRDEQRDVPSHLQVEGPSSALVPAGIEAAGLVAGQAPESARKPSTMPPVESSAEVVAPFAHELYLVVLDDTGRPRPHVEVWLGPELERPALAGMTDWAGEFALKWRSGAVVHEFVLELRGIGLVAGLSQRITIVSGSPERLVLVPLGDGTTPATSSDVPVVTNSIIAATIRHRIGVGLAIGVGDPTFGVDELGNGVITDPWIANRTSVGAESIASGSLLFQAATSAFAGQAVLRMTLAQGGANRAEESEPERASVRGTLVDEDGQALAGAPVTTFSAADGQRRDTVTGEDGTFALTDLPAGHTLVYLAGGAHALQRQDLGELAAGERRMLRGVAPQVERTPLHCVDEEGRPLAGWRIEARRADRNGTLVDRARLDEQGTSQLALPLSEIVCLYVAPPAGRESPPYLVERAFLATGRETTLVVHDDLREASVAFEVEARMRSDHHTVVMRLWRDESTDGISVPLVDVRALGDGEWNAFSLRRDHLLPGNYFVDYGARGMPGKRLGPFHLAPGGEFTLPAIVLEDPAVVILPRGSGPDLVTCSVRTQRQGIRVESPEIEAHLPAKLLCPPGVLDIRLMSGEKALADASLALDPGQEAPFAPDSQH